jgi:hypothetical protein
MFAVLTIFVATSVFAVDDGQTQPRLNYGSLNNPGTSADIVPTTNGSGNVKGVHCRFAITSDVSIKFYVDGGAAQTITVSPTYFPADSNADFFTGWIPLNTRFSSSIRVEMSRAGSPVYYGATKCAVSWALD